MKRSSLPLLFAVSLSINALLLAAWIFFPRPSASGVPDRGAILRSPSEGNTGADRRTEALLAAFATGDAAALAAAGVPAEMVRQLMAARAFARLAAITRRDNRPPEEAEYWRQSRQRSRVVLTREQRAERITAERGLEIALTEAFGTDWNEGLRRSRYSFLPAEKQEQLRRIERDYEDMERELSEDSEHLQLPADRERLKLLQAEKDRDLAAVLSPAEREQIELRNSPSAQNISYRYGDIISSDTEYKRLYALQKAFDDRYANAEVQSRPRTPEQNRERQDAERQLNDALRAALGEDRWATVPPTEDRERRVLTTLTARLGLAENAASQVYALRATLGAQSMAIQQNATLNDADRRSQLTELATRAKTELRTTLGEDGSEAYVRQSPWIRFLQNGSAFTTDARQLPPGSPRPQGGSTVFQIPNPRSADGPGPRR